MLMEIERDCVDCGRSETLKVNIHSLDDRRMLRWFCEGKDITDMAGRLVVTNEGHPSRDYTGEKENEEITPQKAEEGQELQMEDKVR